MRTIVVGDVHGCLEELDRLLLKCEFKEGEDDLVFVGDLIDRGPDPKGVIRRIRELRARSVKGNHEEKAVRYHKHELRKKLDSKYRNPMRPPTESRLEQWNSFEEEDWEFLDNLPLYIRLPNGWTVVHAGALPNKPFDEQPNELMRLRYVRKSDMRMTPLKDLIDGVVDENVHAFWTDLWSGPDHIVYGHQVFPDTRWRFVNLCDSNGKLIKKIFTAGIDTGSCFGGKLTAMIMNPRSEYVSMCFVSESARQKYAELPKNPTE